MLQNQKNLRVSTCQFIVFSVKARSCGNSFVYTPVGKRIHAQLRDYGPAVKSIWIWVCVARNPKKISVEEKREFKKLPNVTFARHNGKLSLSFLASHVLYRDENRLSKSRSFSVEQSNLAMCDLRDHIPLIRKVFRSTDQFDVEAFLSDVLSILAKPIKSLAEFKHFDKLDSAKSMGEPPLIEAIPDDPVFHSRAKMLLPNPVHWSVGNDLPPHGSDLTSSLLRQFQELRTFSRRTKRTTILKRLLNEFDVDDDLSLLEAASNDKAAFSQNREKYWLTNELVLAVACGEIKLKGECDATLLRLAIAATRRHLRPYNVETVREPLHIEFIACVKELRKYLLRVARL